MGRYEYPCPRCGQKQTTRVEAYQGGQAPPHQLCASCQAAVAAEDQEIDKEVTEGGSAKKARR
ncbi:MAG: hypothetical protein ACRDLY_15920 [Thermoleophilaceae bacterium]